MGQKKLIKFAAIKEYDNVLEYPQDMQGKWSTHFENHLLIKGETTTHAVQNRSLTLELACGRGEYAVGLARLFPDDNFIGIDIKGNRIWKGATIANKEGINNVLFVRSAIEQITSYFAKDEIKEIWITFPDPQLRLSKAKKRLTHPRFLRLYQQFLQAQGIVHLKTDSPNLYLFTLTVLELYGLTIVSNTENLYSLLNLDPRCLIKTYYEGLNIAGSNQIYYIQFKLDKEISADKEDQLKQIIAEFEVTETHDAKRN